MLAAYSLLAVLSTVNLHETQKKNEHKRTCEAQLTVAVVVDDGSYEELTHLGIDMMWVLAVYYTIQNTV